MATIVLSAAGMALGSSIGGSFLGLSSAVIGRAVGAVAGRMIDERLLGAGSAPVETGKVDPLSPDRRERRGAGQPGLWPDADGRPGDLGVAVP